VIDEDLRILSYNINLRKSYMNEASSRETFMKIYVQKTKKQTFIHAATKAFMSD